MSKKLSQKKHIGVIATGNNPKKVQSVVEFKPKVSFGSFFQENGIRHQKV